MMSLIIISLTINLSQFFQNRFGYAVALDHPDTEQLMRKIWGMNQRAIPQWQKWLLEAIMPLIRYYIVKKVDTSHEAVEQAKSNMRKHMDGLDSILSDGREFLQGSGEPTYVDFAMASMLGLLTFSPNRGGRAVEEDTKVSVSRGHIRFWKLILKI